MSLIAAPTPFPTAVTLAESCDYCRQLTKRAARNFYYGLKLLPEPKRSSMFALYAWMRLVDDIADDEDGRTAEQRAMELDAWGARTQAAIAEAATASDASRESAEAARLREARSGPALGVDVPEADTHPLWPAFADMVHRHAVPAAIFDHALAGQRQDLQPVVTASFPQLAEYCFRVAGVVGLASIHVWGFTGGEETEQLAIERGLAFQLTNILRDLREDAARGRTYLPQDELAAAGLTMDDLQRLASGGRDDGRFLSLMRQQIARAEDAYRRSADLERRIQPDSRPTLAAMTDIYRSLLVKIAGDPQRVLRERVSLSIVHKLRIGWRKSRTDGRNGLTAPSPGAPGEGDFKPPSDASARQKPTACPRSQPPSSPPSPGIPGEGVASLPSMAAPRILIVGGGLAGMATAVGLEAAGVPVTLLEAGRRLGGRASSFTDVESGREIDNCQHVVLGCCTNILDFYRRLGVEHLVHRERAIHFVQPGGRQFDLKAARGLPAPMHLGPAMAGFGLLSVRERSALSRAMLAMMRLGRAGRAKLLDVPFGHWLEQQRQPASLVAKLYEPILIGALNDDVRKVSAAYAIQVFQDSLLANASGYVLGMPTCPLSQLYAKLPTRDVRLGMRVRSLRFADARRQGRSSDPARGASRTIAGVDTDAGPVDADIVILATNHHAVQKWVPTEVAATDARLAGLARLEAVPILGAHLEFDRPILPPGMSHAAFVTGPLQWVFRKDEAGRVVAGVISAARDWHQKPKDASLTMFTQQLRETLPLAREATLVRGVIVIEKRATFSPLPGIDRLRPTQAPPAGGIDNLFLAGDYTQTGWPATMEGAVRSGYLAAEAVLARLGRPTNLLVDDLPVQWPARLLRRRAAPV